MASRELPVSVALAALSATVALAFGGIFASNAYVGPLVGAALLPHTIGWIVRRWTRSRFRGAAITVAGFVVYAAGLVGTPGPATVSKLVDRIQAGWSVVQSDSVPIRATDGSVLLAVVVVWLMASVADDLAFRERMSVGALAPATMTVIWVRAFAAHGWVPNTIGFGVAAVAFLAVQHQVLLGEGRTRVGQSAGGLVARRVATAIGAGLIAVLVGAAVAPALPGGEHALITDLTNGGGNGILTSYKSAPPLVSIGATITPQRRQVLFTVKASQPEYWRLNTLDTYSSVGGGQWTLNATGADAVGQGLSGPAPAGGLHQTYRIFGLGQRWMPAAYEAVNVSRSDTLVVRSSATLVTGRNSVSGLTYTVDSRIPPSSVTPAQRAATAAEVPAALRGYVALPAVVPDDVRQTARRVVTGLANPYDRALALRDFFRGGQFTYDASVSYGDDGGGMSRFLQERRGACQQFATTYAVMARLVGLPARVATGFVPGVPDQSGVYQVSNHEAHAWPEVWLAGFGWTDLFDPTPTGGLPGESARPHEPPVASTRTPTSTPVPTTTPASTPPGPPTGGGGGSPPTAPNRGVTVTRTATGGSSAGSGLLLIAGLIVAGTLLGAALVLTRRARRRARRRSAADPAALIAGAWAEVLDEFCEAGIEWPRSLTPLEVASGVSARRDSGIGPPLASLAGAYTAARYGDAPPPTGSGDAAWRDADAVLQALDASLSLRARLRARLAAGRRQAQPEPAGWSLPRSRSTKV